MQVTPLILGLLIAGQGATPPPAANPKQAPPTRAENPEDTPPQKGQPEGMAPGRDRLLRLQTAAPPAAVLPRSTSPLRLRTLPPAEAGPPAEAESQPSVAPALESSETVAPPAAFPPAAIPKRTSPLRPLSPRRELAPLDSAPPATTPPATTPPATRRQPATGPDRGHGGGPRPAATGHAAGDDRRRPGTARGHQHPGQPRLPAGGPPACPGPPAAVGGDPRLLATRPCRGRVSLLLRRVAPARRAGDRRRRGSRLANGPGIGHGRTADRRVGRGRGPAPPGRGRRLAATAPLPLPADRPHIGPYRTQFAEMFSTAAAPAAARRIDRTLPILPPRDRRPGRRRPRRRGCLGSGHRCLSPQRRRVGRTAGLSAAVAAPTADLRAGGLRLQRRHRRIRAGRGPAPDQRPGPGGDADQAARRHGRAARPGPCRRPRRRPAAGSRPGIGRRAGLARRAGPHHSATHAAAGVPGRAHAGPAAKTGRAARPPRAHPGMATRRVRPPIRAGPPPWHRQPRPPGQPGRPTLAPPRETMPPATQGEPTHGPAAGVDPAGRDSRGGRDDRDRSRAPTPRPTPRLQPYPTPRLPPHRRQPRRSQRGRSRTIARRLDLDRPGQVPSPDHRVVSGPGRGHAGRPRTATQRGPALGPGRAQAKTRPR